MYVEDIPMMRTDRFGYRNVKLPKDPCASMQAYSHDMSRRIVPFVPIVDCFTTTVVEPKERDSCWIRTSGKQK